MPRKPKTPCKHHGCPELTENRFCEKHKKLHERKSASKRGYDSRWRKARGRFLKANPLCIGCLKADRFDELRCLPLNFSLIYGF